MLTVANSRAMVLSIYCSAAGATNQGKWNDITRSKEIFQRSLKNSIQVSNKVLVASSCVRVCDLKQEFM